MQSPQPATDRATGVDLTTSERERRARRLAELMHNLHRWEAERADLARNPQTIADANAVLLGWAQAKPDAAKAKAKGGAA
jgi:hypothetical protein